MQARVIELHLRHHTQDEIAAALRSSKTRVSRLIRHFHETGLIPNALRGGRPSKITGELASYVEARIIQTPSISGESLFGDLGDALRKSNSGSTIT
jgi:transposase